MKRIISIAAAITLLCALFIPLSSRTVHAAPDRGAEGHTYECKYRTGCWAYSAKDGWIKFRKGDMIDDTSPTWHLPTRDGWYCVNCRPIHRP